MACRRIPGIYAYSKYVCTLQPVAMAKSLLYSLLIYSYLVIESTILYYTTLHYTLLYPNCTCHG